MKNSLLVTALIVPLSLTGCFESEPTETVRTVEWFTEHPTELDAQIAKCDANPGQLKDTPNCVNAVQATWDKFTEAPVNKPSEGF